MLMKRREVKGLTDTSPDPVDIEEEMYTSEESEGEVEKWTKTRDNLISESKEVFEDVKEEYRSIAAVYRRMLDWRKNFHRQYKDAYVTLSLPRLLAPYVRHEIIGWDPLVDGQAVENMQWCMALFQEDPDGGDEEDDKLIPSIVAEVVCPQVKDILNTGWDPSSTGTTQRVSGFMEDILIYLTETHPDAAKSLCNELCNCLTMELERHSAALGVLSKGDCPARAAYKAGRSSFLKCCKIIKNACMFKDLIKADSLQAITVKAATKEMLLPFLQVLRAQSSQDASVLSKVLWDSFPSEWRGLSDLQPLEAFRKAITSA